MELILIGAIATIAFAFGYWLRKKEYDSLLQYSNSAIHTRDEVISDLQDKVKRYEEMRVTLDEKASSFLHEIEAHKKQTSKPYRTKKETKSKKKGNKK